MQLHAIFLVITIIAAAVMLISKYAVRWSAVLTILGAIFTIWLAGRDGIYWQLFPVLFGLALLVISQLAPRLLLGERRPATRIVMATVVIFCATTSFVLLQLIPMFTLPKPTGPYPVGTRIIYLQDTTRSEDQNPHTGKPRELVVQVWYPAAASDGQLARYQRKAETTLATSYRSFLTTNSKANAPLATADKPFTVLLYNHGWSGRRTLNTFLTEELASHGYVVAAIDHPYNSGQVEMPDGRVIEDAFGYDPINPAMHSVSQIMNTWNKELQKWVADETFVLGFLQNENENSKSFWYGRLDAKRTGAFGHSFGGAASIQICSIDPRVHAALNMDGWTFGDISRRPADKPIMFIYGGVKLNSPPGLTFTDRETRTEAELDSIDRKEVDSNLQQAGGYKLFVNNTSHMDFTDHTLVFPWRNWSKRDHISAVEIQTIVRAYVLAFFDQSLRDGTPALLQAGDTSPYPEVRIEQFKPIAKPDTSQHYP
jgi:dienelactone hydrolase